MQSPDCRAEAKQNNGADKQEPPPQPLDPRFLLRGVLFRFASYLKGLRRRYSRGSRSVPVRRGLAARLQVS